MTPRGRRIYFPLGIFLLTFSLLASLWASICLHSKCQHACSDADNARVDKSGRKASPSDGSMENRFPQPKTTVHHNEDSVEQDAALVSKKSAGPSLEGPPGCEGFNFILRLCVSVCLRVISMQFSSPDACSLDIAAWSMQSGWLGGSQSTQIATNRPSYQNPG